MLGQCCSMHLTEFYGKLESIVIKLLLDYISISNDFLIIKIFVWKLIELFFQPLYCNKAVIFIMV